METKLKSEMTKGEQRKSTELILKEELLKAGAAIGFLVVVQFLVNSIGFGSYSLTTLIYVVTLLLTTFFHVGRDGFRKAEDSGINPNTKLPANSYFLRFLVTLMLVGLSIVLYVAAAIILGVEINSDGFPKREEMVVRMMNSSLPVKILILAWSHMCLYGIYKSIVNLLETVAALVLERWWIGSSD